MVLNSEGLITSNVPPYITINKTGSGLLVGDIFTVLVIKEPNPKLDVQGVDEDGDIIALTADALAYDPILFTYSPCTSGQPLCHVKSFTQISQVSGLTLSRLTINSAAVNTGDQVKFTANDGVGNITERTLTLDACYAFPPFSFC